MEKLKESGFVDKTDLAQIMSEDRREMAHIEDDDCMKKSLALL